MADLQAQFKQAQQEANALAQRSDNATLLRLYALYKQATAGDAAGERPGSFDFVRRAKFDSWDELQGTPGNEAIQQYVALVEELKQK